MEKLELKHLAPYLPYGLKYKDIPKGYNKERLLSIQNIQWCLDNGKPILRPLSDLTDEVCSITKGASLFLQEASKLSYNSNDLLSRGLMYKDFQILVENHYDVFGLIEKGLAINYNDVK